MVGFAATFLPSTSSDSSPSRTYVQLANSALPHSALRIPFSSLRCQVSTSLQRRPGLGSLSLSLSVRPSVCPSLTVSGVDKGLGRQGFRKERQACAQGAKTAYLQSRSFPTPPHRHPTLYPTPTPTPYSHSPVYRAASAQARAGCAYKHIYTYIHTNVIYVIFTLA